MHFSVYRVPGFDGSLNAIELDKLFSISPGSPWTIQKFPNTTIADDTLQYQEHQPPSIS
jgi:hypothetical protein